MRDADGRVYVGFKPPMASRTSATGVFPAMTRDFALNARQEVLARGGKLIRTFPRSATIVVDIEPSLAPMLRQLPFVNYVEPVRVLQVAAQDTSWGVLKIGAPTVWTSWSNFGDYSTISFLDSGIDQTHFGFELWATAHCYYDAFYFTSCFDDTGHGSHVIGIATAKSNMQGFIGVAYSPARTASFKVCGALIQCPDDAITSALYFLETVAWPRHIINMSLGAPSVSIEMKQSIARLYSAGVLLVAAAGNNPNRWNFTGVVEPARFPEVMAVSGTLENDAFASSHLCITQAFGSWTSGSNSGPEVEISAPFHATSTILSGQYSNNCGTSMATPLVSATAALVWSQMPNWTNTMIRSRLTTTAVDLGPGGRDAQFGFGRVNAAAAATPVPALVVSIVGPSSVKPNWNCLWEASVSGAPPFSYYWRKNGTYISSASQVTTSFATSGTLSLQVTDAAGQVSTQQKSITVSPTAPNCFL